MMKKLKLARFLWNEKISFGLVRDDYVFPVKEGAEEAYELVNKGIPLSNVKLLTPVQPSKIIAVGLNYRDHAEELGLPTPDEPIIFLKPSSCVIGPGEFIEYPQSVKRLDYEAELAIVIRKQTKNIEPAQAKDVIWGFTCTNDITARDLQKKDIQWTRSKSFDTFCPLGPYLVTGLDGNDLRIQLRLNGELKQDSNTSQMIFRIEEIVSFISKIMTLYPGDVILTGTPRGVGELRIGDQVEVEIENIGILKNEVKGASK